MVTQDIPIDPRYFSDFNQIGLRLIAHYTLDHCEDPSNSALWADVSPTSELILDEAPVRLPNDLALLPAPFFDRRDNGRLRLPFVLPASPDSATLRSAGVLASWFGALADYRQARFPVATTLPADDQAVVIGTAATLPAGLALPAVNGPLLAVADNPAAPGRKLLIVTGRTAAEVDDAVGTLVLGRAALSGPAATVAHVDLGAPRKPYDAPRWLPVDRPIAFREARVGPAPAGSARHVAGRDPPEPARAGRSAFVERLRRADHAALSLYGAERAGRLDAVRRDQRPAREVVPARAGSFGRRARPHAAAAAVGAGRARDERRRHSGVPGRQRQPAAAALHARFAEDGAVLEHGARAAARGGRPRFDDRLLALRPLRATAESGVLREQRVPVHALRRSVADRRRGARPAVAAGARSVSDDARPHGAVDRLRRCACSSRGRAKSPRSRAARICW
jgi:hypothetical protein